MAFPLVIDGAIRVSKVSAQGCEILLYQVTPEKSCVLTSSCLLGHADCTAAAIAETAVTLVVVPRRCMTTCSPATKPSAAMSSRCLRRASTISRSWSKPSPSIASTRVSPHCCSRADPYCMPRIRRWLANWAACAK
ncbi:MAG: cyclic nucleotide-binding domain-containing protein [Betaproteobacteria bacterium]|nr:cyclic nucleotide-binding domain-containing protein [Betaproteobacteria bacterium]